MERPKILMIDDDPLFLSLTEMTLKDSPRLGDINGIADVEDAKSFLDSCKSGENPFPDAIFVDMNMPGMNGMDFVELYRREYAKLFPQTKLVMLTSSISRKEKIRALEFPEISDFMEKPLTEDKLNHLLNPSLKKE